ncbi:MAG: hypothetical protein ACKVIN_00215, partial [Longimicrobiales bacterium]
MARTSRIMGQLLIDDAGVKPHDVETALSSGRQPGERLGDTLVRMGVTTPDAVAPAPPWQVGDEVERGNPAITPNTG